MNLPNFSVYGPYSSNYGTHCLTFRIGGAQVWFSYTTVVAFQFPGHDRVVRKNSWGPTTGKHLNAIDGGDKKTRVSKDEFDRLYAEQSAEFFPETVEV